MEKLSTISRLNVLYILLTLKNHSDSEHPMSIKEITQKANSEFYHIFSDEVSINTSTVSRILDTLCTDVSLGFQNVPIDFFNDESNLGFNIYCVMKMPNGNWEYYKSPESGKGPKKFYYYESIFTEAELTTLIDSVETYNYFSSEDISGLVSKLLGLRPVSNYLNKYNRSASSRFKDENSLVLSNIDDFNRIIKANDFATITYCSYNSKFQLIPRDGYPRLIRPLSMMWSNGYYYLIAILGPGYSPANLRLDRITDVSAVSPTPEMRIKYRTDLNFDATTYRLNHPVMYGGEVQHISMLYLDSPDNSMNNAIMDVFGKHTKIRPATESEITQHIHTNNASNPLDGFWMHADFQSTIGGAELFATQYCRYCKIISPRQLQAKVSRNLKTGLSLYSSK